MANRPQNSVTREAPESPVGSNCRRGTRLRRIATELETMLESLDLETEPQLAEEVIEALHATDRAIDIETAGERDENQR